MSAFNFGWCLGEPNIPEEIIIGCIEGPEKAINGLPSCLPMSTTIWGLVVGLVALGALVGSLIAGRAADRFGRRSVLLANNSFYIIGAVLMGTSTTITQLAIGRFVAGIGCGISSTVVATYNSECAPIKARGLLGTMLQLAVEGGIFFSQLIATSLVKTPNWRILFGLSGVVSLVQFAWLPFMPESPKFLVSKGRLSEARMALEYLRPAHDISNEFADIVDASGHKTNSSSLEKSTCKEEQDSNRVSLHSSTSYVNPKTVGMGGLLRGRTPDVIWHPLFCTLFLMGFQQWTGAKGIVFYSTELLAKVFNLDTSQITHTPNEAQWVTIGLAGAGIVAVLASMALIDRLGRRRLLLTSTAGLALSCALIVVGRTKNKPILAIVSMFSFKFAYGLGMAPIPWLTASEMLPYYALGTVSGLASALNWAMIFSVGFIFPILANVLDSFLFLPFAILNLVAFVVVLLVVPETKGRSISDILFHHGKRVHIVYSTKQTL